MGTNRYQIATISNLQSLYKYGYTGTTTYCPKYSAINAKSWYTIKFNTESEYKTTNFNICPAYYNWFNTGNDRGSADLWCKVLSGSYTSTYGSENIPIALYTATNTMALFNKNNIYGQNGTTIKLWGESLLSVMDGTHILYGCLARASLSLVSGFNVNGTISISACNPIYTTSLSGYSDGLGADYTSFGSYTHSGPSVSSAYGWYLIVIGPSGIIYSTPSSLSAAPSISYSFTVSTTGTHYFCLVPGYIQWTTQYNTNISGYVYTGVYLYFSTNPQVSLPSRSYSSNMLVRYMDISIVNTRTLTVKIYNNKGTQAKLDYIYAYYDTSTTETSSGTQCGGLSIGNVAKNSTASYSLSITIPASIINSSSKYYVHIWCGWTNVNQTWSYKFTSTGSYSSTKKTDARVTTGIQVCRTVSTNTAQFILPNIYGSSPMSEMTFQIT